MSNQELLKALECQNMELKDFCETLSAAEAALRRGDLQSALAILQ